MLFTAENAAEMALRSQESAKRRKAAEALKAEQDKLAPPPANQTATASAGEESSNAQEAQTLREIITKLDKQALKISDPRELQMIANASWRYYERWCIAVGHAKPAPKKASAPARQRPAMVEPS